MPEIVPRNRSQKVTVNDVATYAGVSKSTVSRVINEQPYVRDAIREHVLRAMEELQYRPDVAARSMRTKTSRAVGFVVSDFSNPLFAEIAGGADEMLHHHGYSLVLANSANDPAREAEVIATLRGRRVEGLLLSVADERASGLTERIAQFGAAVLLDRELPEGNADCVRCDHARGIRDAVDHLHALGHADIALVAGSETQLGSRARTVAFTASAPDGIVRTGELSAAAGYDAMRELLTAPHPPTAVIAGSNQLLEGVLQAVSELGLRIPEELSLVTCDDVALARLHDPPLDVIERDVRELGRAAGRLMLERLSEPGAAPSTVVIPTSFTTRSSSARPGTRRA